MPKNHKTRKRPEKVSPKVEDFEYLDKRDRNDALISFNVDFTDEQIKAREVCHNNILTILTGKAGTSKTFIAASVAIELLRRKPKDTSLDNRRHGRYDKIIISRPTIEAGKGLGFLPGDLAEKLDPYIKPVYGVIKDLVGESSLNVMIEKCQIVTLPIQFLRGETFKNCIVIVDESQNTDIDQLKLISSRIGADCKVIMTSDLRQCDLRNMANSAANLFDKITHLDGVGTFELTQNFRHRLAIEISDNLE